MTWYTYRHVGYIVYMLCMLPFCPTARLLALTTGLNWFCKLTKTQTDHYCPLAASRCSLSTFWRRQDVRTFTSQHTDYCILFLNNINGGWIMLYFLAVGTVFHLNCWVNVQETLFHHSTDLLGQHSCFQLKWIFWRSTTHPWQRWPISNINSSKLKMCAQRTYYIS